MSAVAMPPILASAEHATELLVLPSQQLLQPVSGRVADRFGQRGREALGLLPRVANGAAALLRAQELERDAVRRTGPQSKVVHGLFLLWLPSARAENSGVGGDS